jgi:uncharacterized protein YbjQ (UPF0145 family)
MLVVTLESIPGYDVVQVLGPVAATIPLRLPFLPGQHGDLGVSGARDHAVRQVLGQAQEWGADGVLGLRFETTISTAGGVVTAYGTAVRLTPTARAPLTQQPPA